MQRFLFTSLMLLGSALAAPLSATATITDAQGSVRGTAKFVQQGSGVQVNVSVQGLKAGMHGLHIHEFGRCAPGIDSASNAVVPFGGAGSHFDPAQSHKHASPTTDNLHGHGGDLPMLNVAADGTGKLSFTTQKIGLSGKNGVLGRSLVIHAQPDDYKTDPSGMSGAREACGMVTRDGLNVQSYTLTGPQDFPEGVAYDSRKGVLYTGSAANGNIYAINPQSGAVSLFSEGGAMGRASALGLKVDTQGRLWAAGGAQGTVSVLSTDGAPVAILETPMSPRPFINDLVQARDGNVYVTDSARPVLWRVTSDLKITPWLDLTRTPIRYGDGMNLNGIVAIPDGRYLLTVQQNTGKLWRIDLRSKAVRLVMSGLSNADGLLLRGQTLYVARNADGVVSKVALAPGYGSGKLVVDEPLGGLRFPATLAAIGGDLVVTQAQLDKQGATPETPFKLTRTRLF